MQGTQKSDSSVSSGSSVSSAASVFSSTKRTIVVAMSGGVDSSVAAALLKEREYRVIGVMLRLWSESGRERENSCCTLEAMDDARHIAAQLDIPFYVIDAQEVFRDVVVEYFINGYTNNLTPNPCLICNQHIRWGFMYERARALGGDFMATGHYARLRKGSDGNVQLLTALDTQKDQSYVLHVLGQEALRHTLFPLGDHTKAEVRALARDFDLPVAERPDSQDLCFVGNGDYRDFLRRCAPQVENPGPILSTQGERLGEHTGLAFYTIGQRKGLGISAPHPLYVLRKDSTQNALILGTKTELGKNQLTARDVNWVSGEAPRQPFRAGVKIRYKSPQIEGIVTPLEQEQAHIKFDTPIRDITPGQAAVFYDGEVCLGGGIIQL